MKDLYTPYILDENNKKQFEKILDNLPIEFIFGKFIEAYLYNVENMLTVDVNDSKETYKNSSKELRDILNKIKFDTK